MWSFGYTVTQKQEHAYMGREEGIEQNKFNFQNNGKEKQDQGKALTIKAV